jgi:drug/metabolite transporter (DMT)-like permease
MVGHKAPRWQQIYAIPGMLIFGTATVVTQKFLFGHTADGLPKYGHHAFQKPWFQTDCMFLGMTLSLLGYLALRGKDGRETSSSAFLTDQPAPHNWKLYFAAALPALCDLSATSLMNIQLLYIQASVWQMLRGSMTIFSSLFCAFILKREHFPYMWWAVLGVVVSLAVVGVAAVCSTGAGKEGVSQGQTIMAIFLTIAAQLVQATQLVVEDFLLHDKETHPLQLIGLKGMWGFIICSSVCLPIVQFTHGEEGNGVHEDLLDTFAMLSNSSILLAFVILYALFILAYNIGGMLVINVFSAVHRTILEGFRTACIWIVQLIIFYSVDSETQAQVGEEWTRWSFMQLAGFLLLFTSTLMYNKIVRLPCFVYPDEPLREDPLQSVFTDGLAQPLLPGPRD